MSARTFIYRTCFQSLDGENINLYRINTLALCNLPVVAVIFKFLATFFNKTLLLSIGWRGVYALVLSTHQNFKIF